VTDSAPLQREPSYAEQLQDEPWRFDFYAVMRRLERSFPERGRIGAVAARRDEYVALGEPAAQSPRCGKRAVQFATQVPPWNTLPTPSTNTDDRPVQKQPLGCTAR
jgi:predicted component of type VI protein secretion system